MEIRYTAESSATFQSVFHLSRSFADMFADVHAFMQNTNDQHAAPGVPLENYVALMRKTAIAWPYVVSAAAHIWILVQEFQAVLQRMVVKLCLMRTEINSRSIEDLLDILGSGLG